MKEEINQYFGDELFALYSDKKHEKYKEVYDAYKDTAKFYLSTQPLLEINKITL